MNYYAPFALDYCELARRGFDHKAAIRDDVAHFRRLGLDLLRIHCFDRQISRRDGTLACMRLEFGASLYGNPDSPKAFEVSSVRVE